jgi:hypothetical protein
MQNYLQGVDGFINSKPKNISRGKIRCHAWKSDHKDIEMMPLFKKRFIDKSYIGIHTKNYMFLMKPY